MQTSAYPTYFILFWATGDLARRQLFPALSKVILENDIEIIATGRRDYSNSTFQAFLRESGSEFFPKGTDIDEFITNIHYKKVALEDIADYLSLAAFIEEQGYCTQSQIIIYLSLSSEFFSDFLRGFATIRERFSRVKIILEKPFGTDLESARALNRSLYTLFAESDIYRIDHFVAKGGIQNILAFRFANILWDALWDHRSIDNIQITANETLSVGDRGRYYESAGALRDMVQNHLFQMLALILMRRPGDLTAEAIRIAKTEVLRSLTLASIREDVVFWQYEWYRAEKDVDQHSRIETLVAMRLESDLEPYRGIPIYLRTGKCLEKKLTSIVIELKKPTNIGFENAQSPNRIIIEIQPGEHIDIHFHTRSPQGGYTLSHTVSSTPEILSHHWAYEKLLGDIIEGDHTLFTSWEMLEATWGLVDTLIHCKDDCPIITPYSQGSRGPLSMDFLLERDGKSWYEERE